VSGIFGVSSYVVAQRRKEIGVRIALGAASSRIAAMVLRQSLKLAVVGAVFGSAAALAVAQLMAHSILSIDVFDAAAYGGGIAVVIAAAIAAAYVPARRAVKVDPAVTLRCD
jgi:ABC-type antimicrobial peptide transport system permease subunit